MRTLEERVNGIMATALPQEVFGLLVQAAEEYIDERITFFQKFASGGVVSGPEEGYSVELHGPEDLNYWEKEQKDLIVNVDWIEHCAPAGTFNEYLESFNNETPIKINGVEVLLKKIELHEILDLVRNGEPVKCECFSVEGYLVPQNQKHMERKEVRA
jgi:hypothetical protein